jgi:ligand-binding SRPBCC domain-containing protein
MVEKSTVMLTIKRFGISTIWEMKIDTLNCPHTITDMMLKGPFKYFRHERFFSAVDEKTTRMKETLSIVLPFGWLGRLFFPLLKKDMDTMFAYRHRATQRYFFEKY